MTATINFRQLIDLAIGTPEPGHVNFYALHCLLFSFAEKLNLIEKTVDCAKYSQDSLRLSRKSTNNLNKCDENHLEYTKELGRIAGGADPNEGDPEAEPSNNDVSSEKATVETIPEIKTEQQAIEENVEQAEAVEEETAALEIRIETSDETKPEILEESIEPPEELDVSIVTETKLVPELENTAPITEIPLKDDSKQMRTSIDEVHTRLSQIETVIKDTRIPDQLFQGCAIMKDQLELTMTILLKLTAATIGDKAKTRERIRLLRDLYKQLRSLQRANIYIASSRRYRISQDATSSLGGDSQVDLRLEEGMGSVSEQKSETTEKRFVDFTTDAAAVPTVQEHDYELDTHLCYTPEKILDEVLELKSELCGLTNKMNTISEKVLDHEGQRTLLAVQDLQEQIRELKYQSGNLKDGSERVDTKLTIYLLKLENIEEHLNEIAAEKMSKTEIDLRLADKVDYLQLQRKVSHEELDELQCKFEKHFCELQKLINDHEKHAEQLLDNLREKLGLNDIDENLNKFKEKFDHDIHLLRDMLQKYIDATNDDCAAAGARMKVLQDLACLSCDTNCVMRTTEKSKLPKLPNARASSMLSPLITYELGSIRKSGIMGYYRKDDFPHAPNAWLQRQAVNIKACVPRHAGGPHTTHTAKEHVEKVLLNKK